MNDGLTARLAAQLADDDTDLAAMIETAVADAGWPAVRDTLLGMLEADAPGLWRDAAAALYCAPDHLEMDPDRTIALLYHRLGDGDDHDQNLAWSFVCRLRKVGYLSDHDPLDYPGVRRELERLQARKPL